jgi:ABC-type dipeptide/oligopeptide/nickel transport system permease subunit
MRRRWAFWAWARSRPRLVGLDARRCAQFIQRAPWVVTFPASILVTVLAFNLMGDGLRDAFVRKLKR